MFLAFAVVFGLAALFGSIVWAIYFYINRRQYDRNAKDGQYADYSFKAKVIVGVLLGASALVTIISVLTGIEGTVQLDENILLLGNATVSIFDDAQWPFTQVNPFVDSEFTNFTDFVIEEIDYLAQVNVSSFQNTINNGYVNNMIANLNESTIMIQVLMDETNQTSSDYTILTENMTTTYSGMCLLYKMRLLQLEHTNHDLSQYTALQVELSKVSALNAIQTVSSQLFSVSTTIAVPSATSLAVSSFPPITALQTITDNMNSLPNTTELGLELNTNWTQFQSIAQSEINTAVQRRSFNFFFSCYFSDANLCLDATTCSAINSSILIQIGSARASVQNEIQTNVIPLQDTIQSISNTVVQIVTQDMPKFENPRNIVTIVIFILVILIMLGVLTLLLLKAPNWVRGAMSILLLIVFLSFLLCIVYFVVAAGVGEYCYESQPSHRFSDFYAINSDVSKYADYGYTFVDSCANNESAIQIAQDLNLFNGTFDIAGLVTDAVNQYNITQGIENANITGAVAGAINIDLDPLNSFLAISPNFSSFENFTTFENDITALDDFISSLLALNSSVNVNMFTYLSGQTPTEQQTDASVWQNELSASIIALQALDDEFYVLLNNAKYIAAELDIISANLTQEQQVVTYLMSNYTQFNSAVVTYTNATVNMVSAR